MAHVNLLPAQILFLMGIELPRNSAINSQASIPVCLALPNVHNNWAHLDWNLLVCCYNPFFSAHSISMRVMRVTFNPLYSEHVSSCVRYISFDFLTNF